MRNAALAAAAGAVGAHLLLPVSALWYVPIALLGLLTLGSARTRWLVWVLVGFTWASSSIRARLDDRLPAALTGMDFAVAGWIDDFPRRAPGRVTFSFRVSGPAGLPRRLRLSWYDPPFELEPGAALDLRVRLKPPHGLANPGGFDYERWLLAEGYGASGYVRAGSRRAEGFGGPAIAWLRARAELARRIDVAVVDSDASALLTALTLGERFRFSDEHWTVFRRTGTSHLFAISGLHVGLVGALAFLLGRALWLRLPGAVVIDDLAVAAGLALAAAGAYAALAGFTVPTQRALAMLSVGLGALVGRRRAGPTQGVAAALAFVLLWDPLAASSDSFWLSFAAVAFLLLLNDGQSIGPARSRVRFLGRMASLGRIQWGMSVALAPLAILFFGQWSIISPLVNLVAIPFFACVLVPLSLLAAALLGVAPHVSAPAVEWVGVLTKGVWTALEHVGRWDGAVLAVPQPAPWAMALALLGGLAWSGARPLPGRSLAWLAMLALLQGYTEKPATGGARATVLDVGHGLAVLVQTRTHALLYDAGPRYPGGFDAGRDVVLPALARLAPSRLNTLIVSHSDNDHAGGAESVIDAYPDADVLAGADVAIPPAHRCRAGQHWTWDRVTFTILHPAGGEDLGDNDGSCVLRVATVSGTLLLPGDIEARGERLLLRRYPELRADFVLVPHHGSTTSSSPGFVRSLRAKLAVVSAGFANRWGFPKAQVSRRWEGAGAAVVTTAELGAITIDMEPGRGFCVESERGEHGLFGAGASFLAKRCSRL